MIKMAHHTFPDKCSISLGLSNCVTIKYDNQSYSFDTKDKPHFDNGTGEVVIEYSGVAVGDNPDQSWALVNFVPMGHSQLHYHSERSEDYYVVHGQALVTRDGKEYQLTEGDHLHIKPGQRHRIINASPSNKLVMIVKCVPAWVKHDHHMVQNDKPERTDEIASSTPTYVRKPF